MSRRQDYLVAFGAAVWLHSLAAFVFARWAPQPAGIVPLFQQGMSALSVTVLTVPFAHETPPVQPEEAQPATPMMRPEPPAEPAPALPLETPAEDEPALLPDSPAQAPLAPGSSETPEEPLTNPPAEAPAAPAGRAAGGEDGDQIEKGVEVLTALDVSIRPRYPLGSRLRGEEGTVLLRVKVSAAGRAEKIATVSSSGFPALDRAARSALLKASFRPRVGRQSPAGEFLVSIRFQLVN